jgi:hypothetical protein
MLKGHDTSEGTVKVYAYTQSDYYYIGECRSREDYQKFVDCVYSRLEDEFPHEVVPVCGYNFCEDDDELWSNY